MRAIVVALVVVIAARVEAQRGPGWELRVPERVELAAGTGGTLSIAITVDRGLSISKDAALVLDLAPDAAIVIKRRRLGRNDAVDPDADSPRFSVALRGETAGDYTIKLRLRFWLCGSRVCKPVEARRTVAVVVP